MAGGWIFCPPVFAQGSGTNTDYLLKNAHGDTVRLVCNGSVIKNMDYDPYGELTESSTYLYNSAYRYANYYYDSNSGFYYLRNRFYDPSIGRFVSEDPVHDGMNWYAYCSGNPIMYVDPSGYITDDEIAMYENGEMAPAAYSHLMNLTYHWYLADDEKSRNQYHQYAEEFRANNYQTTGGTFSYVDEGIAFMPSMITGEPTKEQHYFRNDLNLLFTWSQLQKMQNRLPEELKWTDNVAANYHQNNKVNNQPNIKYVSFDGHFELVYNANHVLLTKNNNSEDMGTYNYANPTTDPWGHFIKDVKPYGAIWIKWGNVEEDASFLYD